jgi:hypothetical protein
MPNICHVFLCILVVDSYFSHAMNIVHFFLSLTFTFGNSDERFFRYDGQID